MSEIYNAATHVVVDKKWRVYFTFLSLDRTFLFHLLCLRCALATCEHLHQVTWVQSKQLTNNMQLVCKVKLNCILPLPWLWTVFFCFVFLFQQKQLIGKWMSASLLSLHPCSVLWARSFAIHFVCFLSFLCLCSFSQHTHTHTHFFPPFRKFHITLHHQLSTSSVPPLVYTSAFTLMNYHHYY